jgi:hypothetical protein
MYGVGKEACASEEVRLLRTLGGITQVQDKRYWN